MKTSNHYPSLFCILSLLLLGGLLLLPGGARSASWETDDAGRDVQLFCRKIAFLTQEAPNAPRSRGEGAVLVLLRANQPLSDFPESGLSHVLKGPENRYGLRYENRSYATSAAESLASLPGVLYAEVDTQVHASEAPGIESALSFHSAGAEMMGFGTYLPFAVTFQKRQVTVAIVDSGTAAHPFLQGRIRALGWDYVDNDADPTNDLNGHGTHLSGIVADCTQGTGTMIYPIRVLNASASGKLSHVAAGVLEAAEAGVDIINLSLESSLHSDALEDAIRSAIAKGCIVVAAAGNSGEDTQYTTPASMPDAGILVVGSAESADDGPVRASYSNYGSSVDLYACGSNISSCSRSGGYVTQSGTSMAAAHISGACALLRLVFPGITPGKAASVLRALCSEATLPFPSLARLAPQGIGFSLSAFSMNPGDTLSLPPRVQPDTAFGPLTYTSDAPEVCRVDETGLLTALSAGNAQITVTCPVWETLVFTVHVEDNPGGTAFLGGVRAIEEEAFSGTALRLICLSEGIEKAGARAFSDNPLLQFLRLPRSLTDVDDDLLLGSEGAVILCLEGSTAEDYARTHALQYILISDKEYVR